MKYIKVVNTKGIEDEIWIGVGEENKVFLNTCYSMISRFFNLPNHVNYFVEIEYSSNIINEDICNVKSRVVLSDGRELSGEFEFERTVIECVGLWDLVSITNIEGLSLEYCLHGIK